MSNNKILYTNQVSGETGKRVVDYFNSKGGCIEKSIMSDEEYDMLVAAKLQSSFNKEKALEVLGIDESQVREIPPVCFHGYTYNERILDKHNIQILSGECKDGEMRSSAYKITWIFFGDDEIYFFQEIFCLDCAVSWTMTDEFFYNDIVNFFTTKVTIYGKNIESTFSIMVPGETKDVSLVMSERNMAAIEGMKQKLREKKRQMR